MHSNLIRFIVLIGLVAGLFSGNLVTAQEEDAPLRVATKLFPPLVIEQGGEFAGFSIQFWEAIAELTGIEYEFYEVETVTDQIEAVRNGEADAAIAGISITAEREEIINFTFPYFDAGLQIMIRQEEPSHIETVIDALLAPQFVQFFGFFVILILVAAHVLWFAERRKDPELSRSYWHGIGQMMWWSAVTVIGYDDRIPRTIAGRLMALLWMFAGIFLIANLTASLSAGATVRELRSNVNDLSDLRDSRVVTVEGTTSAQFLRNAGIGYTGVTLIEEAYELLRTEEVDAVVYDAPVLLNYIQNEGDDEFRTAGQSFGTDQYGIVLPEGSPYYETINHAILQLQEDGIYQQLYERWFGTSTN